MREWNWIWSALLALGILGLIRRFIIMYRNDKES